VRTKSFIAVMILSISSTTIAQEKKKPDKKDTPRVAVVLPLGVVPGKTAKLAIRGRKLADATAVRFKNGRITAKIVSKGAAPVPDKNPDKVGDTQVVVEAAIPGDVAGNLDFVVVTPAGESKPHMLLVETRLPVIAEKEPNEGFRQAQPVKLPVVIEGSIDRQRDVDVFRFEGKAGQKIVIEVLAARHGSALDSIVTLYDAAGQQIASSDDTKDGLDSRLDVVLPATGVYHIALIDAHDSGGPIHVYRLLAR